MNFWYALIIGLIIGWLLEFLLDLFYWRSRRICPDDTTGPLAEMAAEVEALRQSSAASERQALALATELEKRDGRIAILENELATREQRLNALDSDIVAKNLDLNNLSSRIAGLSANVAAGRDELATLHSSAQQFEPRTESLGLRSLFADGRLTLDGFLDSVQQRITRGPDAAPAVDTADADRAATAVDLAATPLPSASDPLAPETAPPDNPALAGAGGLGMVWGVSASANQILEAQGITTYAALAESSTADVALALDSARDFYPDQPPDAIHAAWVEQATLAAAGDWDALSASQTGFISAALRDDLRQLWGIGPKVEQILNDSGIYLYSQLSAAPAERINEIMRQAGPRFTRMTGKLVDTWPAQARLAEQADWDGLAALTAQLNWSTL